MYKLSEHLTYKEATLSGTAKTLGISNEPNNEQLTNMIELAKNVFEPLRINFGVPIYISSMFRSKALNDKVGGSNTSQHCANDGAAMDLDADMYGKITNEELFFWLLNNVEYDQLIAENVTNKGIGWVHISYRSNSKNRKQTLIMTRVNGKPVYTDYTKEELNKIIQ